jgi:hypothetical protein
VSEQPHRETKYNWRSHRENICLCSADESDDQQYRRYLQDAGEPRDGWAVLINPVNQMVDKKAIDTTEECKVGIRCEKAGDNRTTINAARSAIPAISSTGACRFGNIRQIMPNTKYVQNSVLMLQLGIFP